MKKKKLLSVILAAALSCSCFTAVPFVSLAAEYTSGDYTYSLDNGCVITKYSGSDKNVVIPSKLGGKDVVEIGKEAFKENKDITSVTIPDSVNVIGDEAFYKCTGITELKIGNSVKTLGKHCFSFCSLTSVEIPASLTSSDAKVDEPFFACDSLKSATIAKGGVRIPISLFESSNLENVTIPEGITEIGNASFKYCQLEKISLPKSLKKIGASAFYSTNLVEISLPEDMESVEYKSFYNCVYLKDFYDYSNSTSYDFFDVFGIKSPYLTIHAFPYSVAHIYAQRNNISFVPLTENQMIRLYNKNSGEHFYTSDSTEKNKLVSAGWTDEGKAWIAPATSKTPVYRVYNPNSGEHHYTTDAKERDGLVKLGWKDEGIGWYSDENKGTPLYRLYNPNAIGQYEAGGHHYTKDVKEKNSLIKAGWRDEGIGWYGY